MVESHSAALLDGEIRNRPRPSSDLLLSLPSSGLPSDSALFSQVSSPSSFVLCLLHRSSPTQTRRLLDDSNRALTQNLTKRNPPVIFRSKSGVGIFPQNPNAGFPSFVTTPESSLHRFRVGEQTPDQVLPASLPAYFLQNHPSLILTIRTRRPASPSARQKPSCPPSRKAHLGSFLD